MLNRLSREIVRVSTELVVLTKATLEEGGWPLFPDVAWGMLSRGK